MSTQPLVDGDTVSVTLRGSIKLTGGQLAALFWSLGDDEQIEFFTELGTYDAAAFARQMFGVAGKLDDDCGREAMRVIGESLLDSEGL